MRLHWMGTASLRLLLAACALVVGACAEGRDPPPRPPSIVSVALDASVATPTVVPTCPADSCRPSRAALAVTYDATCVLRATGKVFCWGDISGDGQRASHHDVPFAVRGLDDAVRISGWAKSACVVRKGGGVACWGENQGGQVDPTASGKPRNEPVAIAGVDRAVDVSVSSMQSCALTERGDVVCWGDLGDRDARPKAIPALTEVASLGAPGDCAVKRNGSVVCASHAGAQKSMAMREWISVPGVSDAERVVRLGAEACALRKTGAPLCWGGDLGRAAVTPPWLADAVDVRAYADGNVCTLSRTSEVACAAAVRSVAAMTKVAGISDAVAVGSGGRHACALRANGDVLCWGRWDSLGKSPHGVVDRGVPTEVPGLEDADQIDAAFGHTCVLRKSGEVSCWGSVPSLKPPTAPPSPVSAPQVVAGLGNDVATLALSPLVGGTACVARKDGSVACWGAVPPGAGFEPKASYDGITRVAGVSGVTQLSLSFDGCAAQRGGGALCWHGDPLKPTVTPLPGIQDAVAVAAMAGAACVVRRSGKLTCRDFSGVGATTDVADLAGTVQMSSLGCAVRRDGTVGCIDANGYPYPSSVTPILGVTDAREVDGGPMGGCIVRTNGGVACWGENHRGQVGDGTYEPRRAPVNARGLDDAVHVAVSGSHACAVRKTGRVACWGDATDGHLGLGVVVSDVSPVVKVIGAE